MKAATKANFSISRKYEKFPDLILAFVWHLDSSEDARTYALFYSEALSIGERLGWTATPSWIEGGGYTTQRPSQELIGLLEGHRMTPGRGGARVVDPR